MRIASERSNDADGPRSRSEKDEKCVTDTDYEN